MKKTRLARKGLALAALLGATLGSPALAQQVGTMVRVDTDRGPIDLQLYDTDAPATVANFLGYVRRGAYDGTFFHRLVNNFVLQGGGYLFSDTQLPRVAHITTAAPIVLEASLSRQNRRGTVAMARTSAPNSATSEWFINLVDNRFLDPDQAQDGFGYAVFGRITAPSMVVVDALHRLPVQNFAISACLTTLGSSTGALGTLPKITSTAVDCNSLRSNHLVVKHRAIEVPTGAGVSASDRIFNYIEAVYPQHAAPASQPTQTWEGYTYRYYPKTNAYAGTKGGRVFYLVPALSPNIIDFASEAELLAAAVAAGY